MDDIAKGVIAIREVRNKSEKVTDDLPSHL